MKKLEPGCLAIVTHAIIDTDEIGKILKVKKYIGNLLEIRSGIYCDVWDTSDGLWNGKRLMRIDDDANLEDKETQREKSWSQ